MDHLWNTVKARAGALDGMAGVARFALVSSYDPQNYAAKVLLQPENVLTGWLPIATAWAGNGWGLAAPVQPGDQVLVLAQEGDAEQGILIGCVWSLVDKPMAVPAGEFWLQHSSGSFLKLHNDGSIALQATVVNIQGNLVVSGDISDKAGAHGTLAAFRNAYDEHVHPVNGSVTGLPSVTV